MRPLATRQRGTIALAAVPLAAVVGLVEPRTAIWVVVGLAACALAMLYPFALCCLLVPAVALGSLAPVQVGPLRAGPTDLIVGALGVGALARMWSSLAGARPASSANDVARAVRAWWRRNPAAAALTLALLAYLLVVVASASVAISHSLALKEILKWTEVLVVFVVAASLLRTRARLAVLAWTMIAVGVGEALLGYVQWVATAGDLGINGSGIRVFGTFDQPNPYAAYVNLSLPLALSLALFGRPARARWAAGGATVLLLGAQLLANSRGGLLALAAAVAVVVLVGVGIERIAFALVAAVTVVGGVAWAGGILPPAIQDRVQRLLRVNGVSLGGPVSDANYSSVDRLAHWIAGMRMFLAHPVLGVGAGNYDAAYAQFAVPGWHASLFHAHNYYINAAAETGAIGLAAFLALMGAMLYAAWRAAHLHFVTVPMPAVAASVRGGSPRRPNGAMPSSAPAATQPTLLEETLVSPAGAGHHSAGLPKGGRRTATIARLRRLLLACRPLSDVVTGSWPRALALGLLGVFATVVVHSFVDDVFVHAIELQIALCMALAVGLTRAPRFPVAATPLVASPSAQEQE